MENKNPQLEGYQKVLMYLSFLCMAVSFVLMFLFVFEVVTFPAFIVFVPMVIMNLLGTVALWKRVTKPVRIALILSIPTMIACAIVFLLYV